MFKSTLAAALLIGASASSLSTSSPEEIKALWESFKSDHQKSYRTQTEEMTRFQNFVQSLVVIDQRNREEKAAGGSAEHGITKFSDLTQEEFASNFLNLEAVKGLTGGNATIVDYVKPYDGPATLVDWTGKYTTAVRDQGYCGSCWAFSASEQIESDAIRSVGWTKTWLSPEQLVDCDTRSSGCNGGWPENAYSYVQRAGGIQADSTYPYSAYSGKSSTCKASSANFKIAVTGYKQVTGESNMANYVKATGTLAICLDASQWSSYKSGVLSSCTKNVNHAVQAVGVDDSSTGFWKVRNSWGTGWGESGFIRLKYGQNTCNIAYRASYTNTFRK